MPDRQGGFRARLRPDGLASGQWFQPVSPANPPFGTGINFEPDGPNRWRGEVLPLDDTSTFYLMLRERADGLLGAFLRHREFNLGVRYNLDRLVQDRAGVRLIGRLPGESVERVLLSGSLDPENGVLSLAFEPPLDGVYDFTRAGDESYFYPRGRTPGRLNGIKYGYLWSGIDWPYKNRVVHAFFAGGNGDQGVLVVPELDLVVATNGSNYASRLGLEIQQGLMPRFILPAVREAGDAKDSRVVPREYTVIYV
jgi:hypothetical protein